MTQFAYDLAPTLADGMGTRPGTVKSGMASADYHAHPAISRSALMELERTPRHFWYKYLSGEYEDEESDALRIGSAFHTLVLEPALFHDQCAVLEDGAPARPTEAVLKAKNPSPDSLERQAWWAEFNRNNAGKLIMRGSEFHSMKRMAASIKAEPAAANIIGGTGKIEQSFFWFDSQYEVEVKCRPDFIRDDMVLKGKNETIVLDLKTCKDASPEEFARSIVNYGYDIQAFMQMEGIEKATGKRPVDFVFLCVEKDAPHCAAFYSVTPELLACGEARYHKLMAIYSACRKSNLWPGYGSQIRPISPPEWWVKKLTKEGIA